MPTIVGIFQNYAHAEQALNRMCNAGLDRRKVNVSSGSDQGVRSEPGGRLIEGLTIGSILGGITGLIAGTAQHPTSRFGLSIAVRTGWVTREAWCMAAVGAAAGALIGSAIVQLTLFKRRAGKSKVRVTVQVDNDSQAEHVSNLMDVEGAEDVQGGVDNTNVEAAPEYEGARSQETAPATEQKSRSGVDE